MIEDQPAPKPTDRRPAWDLVIRDAEAILAKNDDAPDLRLVIADMRDRDRIGRERYGVPLTSGNGRDHLVDAYQEQLDAIAYLRAEIDEMDHDTDVHADRGAEVSRVYETTLGLVVTLRGLIGGRR